MFIMTENIRHYCMGNPGLLPIVRDYPMMTVNCELKTVSLGLVIPFSFSIPLYAKLSLRLF